MGKRNYPLKSIKYWYSYDIDEVCALYQSQRLHQQTVRGWVKDGLPVIDKQRAFLIYGEDLRVFLGKMNEKNKCKTKLNEMFCMSCKEAKPFLKNQIQLEQKGKRVLARALCRDCQTKMNKSYSLDNISEIRNSLHVVDDVTLYDSATPT